MCWEPFLVDSRDYSGDSVQSSSPIGARRKLPNIMNTESPEVIPSSIVAYTESSEVVPIDRYDCLPVR